MDAMTRAEDLQDQIATAGAALVDSFLECTQDPDSRLAAGRANSALLKLEQLLGGVDTDAAPDS